ncbi:hypothetical protein JB92DRAFT_2827007 [Gautieria morchelliformis]|nr:hypothetical protein JB92DRAFT_2827007 [Gautieria morchelliformis]
MSYASPRCTSVRPNFRPEVDRALDLVAPMLERAMASLGADMARTLDYSLPYAPAYLAPYGHASRTSFPSQRPLSTQPRPPTTTVAFLRALAALNSFPRAHRAVIGADRELRLGMAWAGPGVGGWGRNGTETSLKRFAMAHLLGQLSIRRSSSAPPEA